MEASDLRRIARRSWWILVIVPLLVTAIVYAVSARQPKRYAATATLLLNPNNPAESLSSAGSGTARTDQGSATTFVTTQLGVITGRTVLTAAAATLPGVDTDMLAKAVSANQRGNTTLVEVTVRAKRPADATVQANAIVSAYVEDRRATSVAGLERALAEVKRKLTEIESKVAAPQVASSSSGNQLASALSQAAQVQFAELFTRQQELEIDLNLQRGGIELVSPATPPDSPVSPSPLRDSLVGLVLGTVMAIGITAARERFDLSVRDAEQVAEIVSLPVLATLPYSTRIPKARGLLIAANPFGSFAEAIRNLRTSLQFAALDRDLHVVVVTSTLPTEGKSTIAANLAASWATSGKRTLLVSGDLRVPSADRFFIRHAPKVGLSDLINAVGRAPDTDAERTLLDHDLPRAAVEDITIDGLWYMASGTLPPNPSELLAVPAAGAIFARLRRDWDVVVVDSPPIGLVSDALVLATYADGTILVAGAGVVSKPELNRSVEQLQAANSRVLGVAVNREPGSRKSRDGYSSYGKPAAHQVDQPAANPPMSSTFAGVTNTPGVLAEPSSASASGVSESRVVVVTPAPQPTPPHTAIAKQPKTPDADSNESS